MSRIEKKNCLFCNEAFLASRKNHLFCSKLCSKKAWREKNPEKVRKYLEKSNKKWRINNQEKIMKRNKIFVKTHIKNRTKLIKILGGKCSRCGYNEFITSLVLHHKKGNVNEGGKWKRQYYHNLNKVNIEDLDVLCANCHDALHKRKWVL